MFKLKLPVIHQHLRRSKALFIAESLLICLLPGTAAVLHAQDTTSTTAHPGYVVPSQKASKTKPSLFITFVPKSGSGLSPQITYGCNIPPPSVTANFTNDSATWIGSISCNVSVGLYGTTVLFDYPSGPNVAYGNQINTTSENASSSGSYSGLSSGNYEVNFNIDITPPAGYTTTPGSDCHYISGTELACTVGSGEFNIP